MLFSEIKCEHICRLTEDNKQVKCCRCTKDPLVELCSWCVIEEQIEKDHLTNALEVIENQLKDKSRTKEEHNSVSMKHYELIMRRAKYDKE